MSSLTIIDLPKPTFTGGNSIMEALKSRCTVREISSRELPIQTLSNLLWAAFGVNRRKGEGPFRTEGRTAASASNAQEIDLYVALPAGIYLYEAVPHRLLPVVSGDLRPLAIGAAQNGAGANAPVRIIYVVDIEKFKTAGFQEPGQKDPETQKAYYYVDTGLIGGNVALFAAAHGLTAWFHNCHRSALAEKLNLRPSQRLLFAQTVGWAK